MSHWSDCILRPLLPAREAGKMWLIWEHCLSEFNQESINRKKGRIYREETNTVCDKAPQRDRYAA